MRRVSPPGEGGSSDMRKSQLRVPSSEGSPAPGGAARMFEHVTIPGTRDRDNTQRGAMSPSLRAEDAAPKELE